MRAADLEQLEQLSAQYPSRERFLTELALDPPAASGDLTGPPLMDEDYLILSTVHSAKGQEWDAVYVLNVTDGSFPSEFAGGKPEQIEEERRLLYVAMTRAQIAARADPSACAFTSRSSRASATSMCMAPAVAFSPSASSGVFARKRHRSRKQVMHVCPQRQCVVDAAATAA